MITSSELLTFLNELYPEARCELNYQKDYELLIAVALSAQTTDKKVNEVTQVLFSKYDIFSLCKAELSDIEDIIKIIGFHKKKSMFIKKIANQLVNKYDGTVPNDREFLESLPGVGRKTANVVLSNLFNVPAIAVDTHVSRVSKRLGFAKESDSVEIIEQKLMKKIPKSEWIKVHHQLVLFGRYNCKSQNPECNNCELKNKCKYYKKRTKS